MLGLAGLAAAALAAYAHGGIATALAIGLAVQALTYLTAPLVALAADRSLAHATTNLLDIPAVATAAGLHQPSHPARGRPGSAHARTPQPAGRSHAHRRAHHAHVSPQRPLGRALSQTPSPASTAAVPPSGQTQAGIPRLALADRADDYRLYEPSENRHDSYGAWYRLA